MILVTSEFSSRCGHNLCIDRHACVPKCHYGMQAWPPSEAVRHRRMASSVRSCQVLNWHEPGKSCQCELITSATSKAGRTS